MPVVVNLYAGPSAGKSVAASEIFAELKKRGKHAEIVQEVAKEKAHKKREFTKFDQFFFFGMQSKRETDLYKTVDFIVTDSPLPLNAAYGWKDSRYEYPNTFYCMAASHLLAQDADQIRRVDIWLNRMDNFQEEGRIHDQTESIDLDVKIKQFLQMCGIRPKEFDVATMNIKEVVDHILKEVEDDRR